MALRFTMLLLFLLTSTAIVAQSSAGELDFTPLTRNCEGMLGQCAAEDVEMGLELEARGRSLRGRHRRVKYISYEALNRNMVPCNQPGASYYNCQAGNRANTYRRGCSVITKCARYLY